MSQWTKLADKLPPGTGAYIVAYKDKYHSLSDELTWYITDGVYYSSDNKWFTGGELNNKISHWMSYPLPPKEDEK